MIEKYFFIRTESEFDSSNWQKIRSTHEKLAIFLQQNYETMNLYRVW